MRDVVFVSYSHADTGVLAELETVLGGLGAHVNVNIWSDARIAPSAHWRGEIEKALATSAAAVLLVSRAFLDSTFIRDYELPPLLDAAHRGELQVFAVVLDACAHQVVTETFQAVNDPARPLAVLSAGDRQRVWQRLAEGLAGVAAHIDDEARIGAETERLARDAAAAAEVVHVTGKIERARVDPAFEGHDAMRENTLVMLEGQLCQALATWLIEESKKTSLSPARSKAIVRMLEGVARRDEAALRRATELTKQFADETMAQLTQAKRNAGD